MVFKGDLSAQSHLFFQPQSAAGVQVWDRWKLDLTSVGASLSPQVGREEGQGGRCSVAQSCPTLYDLMDCSTPGFPILHHLPELAQSHGNRVLIKSGPGNRGASERGTTHEATSGMSS